MCTVGSHPMVNHMSSSGFNTRLRPQTFSWQAYTQMTVGVSHVREAHTIRLSSFLKPRTSLDMGSSSGEYRYGGVCTGVSSTPDPTHAMHEWGHSLVRCGYWLFILHRVQGIGLPHCKPDVRVSIRPGTKQAQNCICTVCQYHIALEWGTSCYHDSIQNAIAIDIHPQTMPLSYQ